MKDLRKLNSYRNSKVEKRLIEKKLLLKPNFPQKLVGVFSIPLKTGVTTLVIADNGYSSSDWEHVTASTPTRCLTWNEMCEVKDFFFYDDECVVQYHPSKKDYVNIHEYCLHLWKPKNAKLPLPPKYLV